MDFPGHGGKDFPQELFSIRLFSESVLKWMDENGFQKINIFGYSMGGMVALYMANYFPERVGKIITLGTKMEWDHFIAGDMTRMIDAEKIAVKAPILASALQALHQPNDWKEVLHRTTELFLNLGSEPALLPADFSAIKHDVLLLLGDMDRMVTPEETKEAHSRLENSEFKMLPETPHPIEQTDPVQLAKIASEFFQK
jgi:pimeloyl-ACP methyl ester carboxylesterase